LKLLDNFSDIVRRKLRILGFSAPSLNVVRTLVEIAYLGTLRTEEGRFVRGSLTFAKQAEPDINPPIIRRVHRPSFTAFNKTTILTVDTLVKFCRAVDKWSGSIAIDHQDGHLVIWGIVDQVLHHNILLNREDTAAPMPPGTLTITMDGVAELSAYHKHLLLAGLRQNRVLTSETDALGSDSIVDRVTPTLIPVADAITGLFQKKKPRNEILESLLTEWTTSVSRLCIGLRRIGTGGAFLLSPICHRRLLDVNHTFSYARLRDSSILRVADSLYRQILRQKSFETRGRVIDRLLMRELSLSTTDLEDRERELTGAVKVVTSLAALDGAVLMTPDLAVLGFGTKIRAGGKVGVVYDGRDYSLRRRKAKLVDLSQFGTRHLSMIRYCRRDPNAFGIIVSQDGQIRVVTSSDEDLILWQDVKLLQYGSDVRQHAREAEKDQRYWRENRARSKVGYTKTPKTLDALMRFNEKPKLKKRKPAAKRGNSN
jgi:hypothetical protein